MHIYFTITIIYYSQTQINLYAGTSVLQLDQICNPFIISIWATTVMGRLLVLIVNRKLPRGPRIRRLKTPPKFTLLTRSTSLVGVVPKLYLHATKKKCSTCRAIGRPNIVDFLFHFFSFLKTHREDKKKRLTGLIC